MAVQSTISLKYITRTAHKKPNGTWNVRGWWVRVPGCRSKLFSDSVLGGRLRARDAAIDHRNALCAAQEIPVVESRVVLRSPRRRRTRGTRTPFGIVGVHIEDGRRAVATWTDANGRPRRTRFSFSSYDSIGQAIDAAIACRRERTDAVFAQQRDALVHGIFGPRGT